MTNVNITGGIISVEDGTKAKEEFAPGRKIRVELHFDVPEGVGHVETIDTVAQLANDKVLALLGRPAPKAVVVVEAAKPAKKAAKVPERTKADLAKEAGLPEETLEEEPAKQPAKVEDDLSDVLDEEVPVPITDKELNDAAQRKNGERKAADPNWSAVKIREVIAKYSGGKHSRDIPADKRAAFLKELDALK